MFLHLISGLSLVSLVCWPVFSRARTAEAHSLTEADVRLKTKLQRIIDGSGFKKSDLGLVATHFGVGGETDLIDINGGKRMIPASLTKVVTAAAALEYLGPTQKFETELWSPAVIEDGVLKGDLILKGGGDPGFVSESMWFLVNEFVRTGVKIIEGGIVVDDGKFDNIRFDPGREPSRVDRAYDAPIGAMSFNWNAVNIFVRPGEKKGGKALTFADPENTYIVLKNETTTGAKGSGNKIAISRLGVKDEASQMKSGDVVMARGSLGLDSPEVVVYKNISQPDLWSGNNLLSFLRQRGIVVKGNVSSRPGAARGTKLAKAESKPVSSMVTDMLKFSNNFVAEMLTKNMAAASGVTGVSMEQGMQRIRMYLESIGVKKSDYILTNPSGLSRDNQMRPKDLQQVLNSARRKFEYFPEYIGGFPISGLDGTLKRRMHEPGVKQQIRAKTGLLNGVVGLAGFAADRDGGITTFVFVYNGNSKSEEKARNFFDQLAENLVQ